MDFFTPKFDETGHINYGNRDVNQKADILIKTNLKIISSKKYTLIYSEELSELSKDDNFIKAIDCSYITIDEILAMNLDDPFSLDTDFWYNVKSELDIIRARYTKPDKF